MPVDKIQSDPYREILVTDIDYRFDFGERESLTLREGDVIDRISEPGWIIVTLQPLVAGAFPEVFRHQVSKVISERHQIRLMRVKADPPTGRGAPSDPMLPFDLGATEEAASVVLPVGPVLPDSIVSLPVGTVAPESPFVPNPPTPRAPRAPRLRRKTRGPSRPPLGL